MHKKKKCKVMHRKGLFHYVALGSNVVHLVEKGSHVQSRVQRLSIADRQR